MEHRGAVVGKVESAEFNFAAQFPGRRAGSEHGWVVGDLRLFDEDFVDPLEGSSAALEDIDHPAQRNYGPSQLDHVSKEGGKLAYRYPVLEGLPAADPQHQHYRQSQRQFKRWPEQAHQAGQWQAAVDVFGIGDFKLLDLGGFLHVGADHAGSGKILLRAR